MNSKSKQRFNDTNKVKGMKRGQVACIVPGNGINPAAFVSEAGLVRVTPQGIFIYAK